MVLASTRGKPGVLAHIGRTTLALLEVPEAIDPPHGGWLLVLEAWASSVHAASDLLRLPPGVSLDGTGIVRALLFASSEVGPDPVPPAWSAVPEPPFASYEEGETGALPLEVPGAGATRLRIEEVSTTLVAIRVGELTAEVPRYWAARMLHRLALHGLRVGYAETYGGFFVDDREPLVRIGLRGPKGSTPAAVEISREQALPAIERMYRAVAPPGYRERPS
jgi:hypothetical protein